MFIVALNSKDLSWSNFLTTHAGLTYRSLAREVLQNSDGRPGMSYNSLSVKKLQFTWHSFRLINHFSEHILYKYSIPQKIYYSC